MNLKDTSISTVKNTGTLEYQNVTNPFLPLLYFHLNFDHDDLIGLKD